MTFEYAAKFVESVFGSQYDIEEGFFICPECGEPVYKADWSSEETEDWKMCPVCGVYWSEVE